MSDTKAQLAALTRERDELRALVEQIADANAVMQNLVGQRGKNIPTVILKAISDLDWTVRAALEDRPALTRLEVIDDTGRVLTSWHKPLTLSVQDEGRTLKVFVQGVVRDCGPQDWLCDGCGRGWKVVSDQHTAGIALCPACWAPPAEAPQEPEEQ